jgi:hypothetical protein
VLPKVKLTPWIRAFRKSVTREISARYVTQRFIVVFTRPVINSYPEPDESSPYSHTLLFKIYLNIVLRSPPKSLKRFFPSGFLATFNTYPMLSTYPTHLIVLHFIRIIAYSEGYIL